MNAGSYFASIVRKQTAMNVVGYSVSTVRKQTAMNAGSYIVSIVRTIAMNADTQFMCFVNPGPLPKEWYNP